MADRKGAYGAQALNEAKLMRRDSRRTWDKAEYERRAREKDEAERERMQEADEAIKKGKKPRRKVEDLPKPTELMKQHDDLQIDKNLGKTMIVQAGTRGAGAPGFYCDVCNRTSKDSAGYLNHLNSRYHLRKLGQKTQVARSTLDQVRAKIAALREATRAQAEAKQVDFEQRLRNVKDAERKDRLERKEAKKREREQRRRAQELARGYKKATENEAVEKEGVQATDEDEMARLMGFSGGFKGK